MKVSRRVLLVTSAAPSQTPFSTWEKKPPLGVGFLISMLRNAGHEVFFIDNYLKPSDFLAKGYLQSNGIDYIGIYANTICFRDTLRMLHKIEYFRRSGQWTGKIILGGPHTTVALDTVPAFVDHIVQGEGEQAIVDIVDGKVMDRIVRYPRIRNLDTLPMPAWDYFTKLPYSWEVHWFPEKPVFTMTTSRGCPFNCAFCSVGAVWGKLYTCFSAARIVSDIEHLIEHYSAKGIYFREDNFTLNRKRVVEFCNLLLEKNIHIHWACESRVDNLDRDLLCLMHKAGARGFYFGVESGSQRILDDLHKGITVDQIRATFNLCHEIGFKTAASIVVGLPHETEEDLAATDALLAEIRPTMTWHNVYVGIPNSQLYRYVIEKNLYEFIDDRGLVYLKGHNQRTKRFYPNTWDADIPFHPESPSISVIMAAHNAGPYLDQAIQSVLKQTHQNFELLVIDDASTDNTRDILGQYCDPRIRIIENSRKIGPAGARNKALAVTTGKYIAVMDADDISLPHRFEAEIEYLEQNPEVALVGSSYYEINDTDQVQRIVNVLTDSHAIKDQLLQQNWFGHSTVLIRKDALAALGGYDEIYRYSHDYDLFLRMSEKFKLANIEEPLVCWRSHPCSISSDKGTEQKNYAMRAVAAAKERRKNTQCPDENPLVSIIVPTYKRPDMLMNALKSIFGQTYQYYEVIVINDGGSDVRQLFEGLNNDKIRCLQHDTNRGLPAARNTGIKAARGKYVAYLDDDDLFYPDHLETLVNFLESTEYQVAYTDAHRSYQEMRNGKYVTIKKEVPYSFEFDYERILKENFIPVLCVMHRRSCLDTVGLFDETLQSLEDWDLWMRMSRIFQFAHIPLVTCSVSWRQDGSTMTSGQQQKMKEANAIVVERGKEYHCAGRIHTETQESRSAHESHPAVEAHESILKLFVTEGKRAEAVFALERLVESFPDYAPAYNDLGVLYGDQGNAEKALAAYEKSVSLDPENATFRKNLADFYYVAMTQPDAAVPQYEKALVLNPHDTETLLILGNIQVESENVRKARACYLNVLEIDPTNELAGKMFDALDARGQECVEGDPESLLREARVLAGRGLTDRAIGKLETLLHVSPGHALAYNDLGFLHYRKGDTATACCHYEKAVALNPDDPTLLKNLADLYFVEAGRMEDALRIYHRILQGDPDDLDALKAIGSICVQRSLLEDASVFFERILNINPQDEEARKTLESIRRVQYPIEDTSLSCAEGRKESVGDLHREGGAPGAMETHNVKDMGQKKRASIIIPVFNKVDYTKNCVDRLRKNTPRDLYELIVVDNASSDGTAEYLKGLGDAVNIIANTENTGFVIACNQGAELARGEYLVFLNNDTEPIEGWLESLIEVADGNPRVGAVGAKLILPDGRLQEAGGIVFSDGNGWNFGYGDDPAKDIYNIACEVDYCSGACLLVRKSLFDELGGLDKRYIPAYYEETDLCFGLRKMGYQVVYNPRAVVIHHESITAGRDTKSGFKKYIEINRRKFVDKWKEELIRHEAHPTQTGEQPVTASRTRLFQMPQDVSSRFIAPDAAERNVLFFFPQNPHPPRTGAHQRFLSMLRSFKELGFRVTVASTDLFAHFPWNQGSAEQLEKEYGIKVALYRGNGADRQYIDTVSRQNHGLINWKQYTPPGLVDYFRHLHSALAPDIVMMNYAYWGALAAGDDFSGTRTLIDTHDLLTLGIKMKQALGNHLANPPFDAGKVSPELVREDFFRKFALDADDDEYDIYNRYDYTIAISPDEASKIQQKARSTRVIYIPMTFSVSPNRNTYDAPPVFAAGDNLFNIQGYLYLASRVLPAVLEKEGRLTCDVLGDACKHFVEAPGTRLLGFVKDIKAHYAASKFAICPLIGGTGMQVKIPEAMAQGLPVITLKNVSKSSPVIHGVNGFIAESAHDFGEYMIELFNNRELCRKMGRQAAETIAEQFSERNTLETLSEITSNRAPSSSRHEMDVPRVAELTSDHESAPMVIGKPKTTIAVGLTEHFGDIVACEPVSRFLRENHPEAHIVWVVNERYRELIDTNPNIDETLAVRCLTEWITLADSGVFDQIIDLHVNGKSCPVCKVALLKSSGNTGITEKTYYSHGSLLQSFCKGAGLRELNDAPRVYIPDSIKEKVDLLELPPRFITLHCLSNDPRRDWRDDKWDQLARSIRERFDLPVVEIGIRSVLSRHGQAGGLNQCGRLSLLETAEVIKRSELFIGIDSGPAHLANAVGTPGIILLGHFVNFREYLPYTGHYAGGEAVQILRNAKGPASDISVEKVLKAVGNRIRQKTIPSRHDWPARETAGRKGLGATGGLSGNGAKLIAFYSPHFHPIIENDIWWGRSFTDWRPVTQAKPCFPGHYQPHLPSDFGFYDLQDRRLREEQARIARMHGIHGFCFWYYWFNGKMLLEGPLQDTLACGQPDIPFCLAWRNGDWTRRQYGLEPEILQAQTYGGEGDFETQFQWLLKAFRDRRYITIEGKPLLLISNPSEIPDIASLTACWKKLAERNGFKGLFLMAVHDTAGVTDDYWKRLGFDGSLLYQPGFEFPRRYLEDQNRRWLNQILNGKERWGTAKQLVIPYYVAWPYMAEANSSTAQDPSLFSCVTPSWDDSPKRPAAGATILHHASPGSYESWLRMELQRVGNRTPDRRIVFINAWNSWADGCHLEPDLKFGRQFLQATRRALRYGPEEFPNPDWHLFKGVAADPSCLDERFHHLVRSLQSSARERAILQHEIKQLTAQGHTEAATLKTEWLDVAKEKSAQIHLAMADCLQRRGTPDRAFSHLRIAAALQGECHPGTSGDFKEKPASPCDGVPSPCVQGNVSVILPLSDNLEYGKNCLRALLSYTGKDTCEIIVINRTGQEETTLHLERLNRQIKVIAGEKDESVSESLNRGAEAANGRYLVFLSDEAEVLPDWISPLAALVSDDARVGAVGPSLILPNGQVYSAGQIVLHDKRSKDPLTFRGIVSAQTLDGSEDGKPRIVQVLDSSCLLIRRTAFEDVGGFDRKFHIWGCHIDLLFKLQKRGWLAVCQPASTVFRFGNRYAPEQVQRAQADLHHMHVKWQGKIRPDFVAELDGTVGKGEAGIIREYVSPQNRLPSGMPLNTGDMGDHVSIVILTFNELEYTKKCVESIRSHTPELHEIIFVDNGSKDGTLQWLRELVKENPGYRLIENGKNLGFAKGCNQGIEAATGNDILLLNNDTVVTDGWLSGMLECLKSTPEAGIVGPMTNNISGVQKVGWVGYDAVEGLERYARSFREKNRHRRTEARRMVGFCMLFRRSLVDQIGLLDESFGTGNFEDDDFCARAALAGYRNVIAGDVFIHHFGSRSFIGNRIDYGSSLTGNRKIYNDKWRDIEQKPHEGRKIRALVARELAWKSSQRGDVKGAVDLYLSAIQQDPQDKRNYTELAHMLIQSGRHGDALDALRQCPVASGDADRLVLEGQCREGLNELEAAGNLADLALSMSEAHAPALNLKGILAFRQNAAEQARESFEKAAEADPSWGEPLTNLGVLLWAAGERDKSFDLLEKGFILSPHSVDLAERYHAAAVSLGAQARAEKVFREARSLNPSSRTIAFLLIDLLISQEDHGTAMEEIEAAMAAFETDDGFIAAALEVRGKIGSLEIEKKGNRDTLSLCMIVKNEQPNLVRCLSSVKAAVDEIIVVDTGSTDRTKDIAAVFGAKVFDFAWDEDFSGARNFSLSKAAGEWILVLDADETVSSRDHERLRSLIRKCPKGIGGYDLTTRNYVIEPNTAGWTANDGSYRDEEAGTGWYPNRKVRLFRRDPRIRFSGAVHELVEPSMLGAGMKIVVCDVPVHHTGKLDRVRVTEKGERYFLLGLKKIEESGGTPRAILELAIQAGELGRYDDAIGLWRRYLDGKPAQDVSRAYVNLINACLNADRFDEALDEARKASVHANGTRELLLNCAAAEFFAGDVRKAIRMTEKLLKNEPDYPPALSLLAICCALAGHAGASTEHLQRLHETGLEPRAQILPVIEKLRKVGKKDQADQLLILMDWQPRNDNAPSLPSPDRNRQGSGCSVQR